MTLESMSKDQLKALIHKATGTNPYIVYTSNGFVWWSNNETYSLGDSYSKLRRSACSTGKALADRKKQTQL